MFGKGGFPVSDLFVCHFTNMEGNNSGRIRTTMDDSMVVDMLYGFEYGTDESCGVAANIDWIVKRITKNDSTHAS